MNEPGTALFLQLLPRRLDFDSRAILDRVRPGRYANTRALRKARRLAQQQLHQDQGGRAQKPSRDTPLSPREQSHAPSDPGDHR